MFRIPVRPVKSRWISGRIFLSIVCLVIFGLSGCGEKPDAASEGADTDAGKTVLTAWAHHGKSMEWETLQQQVVRFNGSQEAVRVELVEIPEADYNTQVQSAAATRELPGILEFDGPMLANYVWKGYLQPLDDVISADVRSSLLPSIEAQGTYRGRLYAVGVFDSGLALFGNIARLTVAGIRIPRSIGDAWSVDEFDDILARLSKQGRQNGSQGYALDIKRDYTGEWWTYAFYPALVSGGAQLIDTTDYWSADGVLNSRAAVRTLQYFQRWMKAGYIAPNTDGRAFIDGRVALSWAGHWEYPRYSEAMGENLCLIPLPDFGDGTRTAMGSWCWGITRNCRDAGAAAGFLDFLMSDAEVLAMIEANGAVPGTQTAAEKAELYRPGGPLRLFVDQLNACAVPRARTPAYPVITSAFQEAMADILSGAPVKKTLDRAVRIIDENIEQNEGYPSVEEGKK